ncbi:TPA: hypothetical protein R4218_002550 [Klebsiella pneumoniae]|uniref:hypothetical protein n=1 Tax=Klebsiella variicola TaxID=244366 RepID=UPI000D74F3A4|nr:hypothetical protein [Klebsiella variicola]PXK26396.1 hypothetical protein DMR83_00455 [Klebsiella variicola]HED3827036.1 hypothetical protein [Klebsiella pneumoniae]
MAKNSIDVYGASGKTNVLNFEPENLHLVTDKTHPLYDERVHLPIEEGMVLNIAVLFGCSVQTVRATLSLPEATQTVREAVEAGTVTVTQARQLASLKPEVQREKVSEIEAATADTTGHEKARRQRQILGEAKPRLKTRKEITKALESADGEYANALRWVLGESV